MSLFGHDAIGDLDRGPNNRGFVRVTGAEEARVRVETNLRLVRGEVKLDLRAGLDHQYLFNPGTESALRANHIASNMLSQPGITDVQLRYEVEFESGVLDITSEIDYELDDQNARRPVLQKFIVEQGQDIGGPT